MKELKKRLWTCRLALASQGKSQDAIAHCREALRLQPDFPDARQTLESWTDAPK